MPMFDFVCESCGYHDDHFYHASDQVPDSLACDCGGVMRRTLDPNFTLRRPHSVFRPIVVHRRLDPETGRYIYSYPGRPDDPTPEGYERVELCSLQQAERFCRDREQEVNEERQFYLEQEQAYWDERTKRRREEIRSRLKSIGIENSKVFDLVRQYVDKRREEKRRQLKRRVNFYIQAIEFDPSNRAPYIGDEPKISVLVNGLRGR